MKGIYIALFLILVAPCSFGRKKQNNYDRIQLKNIDNKQVTISEIAKNDSIIVISFWATWCKPCMEELNAIDEKLENWKARANFTFFAISTDDVRTGAKVKSLVNGKGWKFMVLKDQNQDLKRHFNINTIPCTIILKNGEMKFQHSGYSLGNETLLFKEIEKLNE